MYLVQFTAAALVRLNALHVGDPYDCIVGYGEIGHKLRGWKDSPKVWIHRSAGELWHRCGTPKREPPLKL
jgi:hypothetical protein